MLRSFSPVLLLWLVVPTPAVPSCAKSLGYKFTITPSGQAWYELQGQVNGNTFVRYICRSEVEPVNVQGLKVNASEAWKQQRVTVEDVMEELRKKLLDIKADKTIPIDPLSLQGSMMCKQEANGLTNASWELGFNGTILLHLDSESRNWTVLRGESRQLKETLESVKDMTDFLVKTSVGDCGKWLNQVFCAKDEALNTKAAPTTTEATVRSKATTKSPITAIIPVILTCSIIIGIIG